MAGKEAEMAKIREERDTKSAIKKLQAELAEANARKNYAIDSDDRNGF